MLAPHLIRASHEKGPFKAIIIDPIYKILLGDENCASEVAQFCNSCDEICARTGSAVILIHHHSKGYQGSKKATDRFSGSGVFARDPDAVLDLIQLNQPPAALSPGGNTVGGHTTAWRMEGSLREFPDPEPVNLTYEHPLHRVDAAGTLATAKPLGNARKSVSAQPSSADTSATQRLAKAFQACQKDGRARVPDIAQCASVSERTVRNWLKQNSQLSLCANERGVVRLREVPGGSAGGVP